MRAHLLRRVLTKGGFEGSPIGVRAQGPKNHKIKREKMFPKSNFFDVPLTHWFFKHVDPIMGKL